MPWATAGLLNPFRRLGPVLFATGLLLVTCYGHDVNVTVTSSPRSIVPGRNPTGFDEIHEGGLLQVGEGLLISSSYIDALSYALGLSSGINDSIVNYIYDVFENIQI
jgi:hypothetical protein